MNKLKINDNNGYYGKNVIINNCYINTFILTTKTLLYKINNTKINRYKVISVNEYIPQIIYNEVEINNITLVNLPYINLLTLNNIKNIKSLKIKKCKNVDVIGFDKYKLEKLYLIKCELCRRLIQILNLEKYKELRKIKINECKITNLYFSHLTNLEYIDCSDNYISLIKLAGCYKLKHIDCHHNKLKRLEINHPLLKYLDCSKNNDMKLSLQLHDLEVLKMTHNKIYELNTEELHNIKELILDHNKISELDIKEFTNIKKLSCNDNELIRLIIPSTLRELKCKYNKLKMVEIRGVIPSELRLINIDNDVLINGEEIEDINKEEYPYLE